MGTRSREVPDVTRRPIEWWISIVRLLAVPFAVLQVSLTAKYPSGYELIAWLLTAVLAVGAVALFTTVRDTRAYRFVAMAFDFAIVAAFTVLYGFELGTPTRQLLFLAIVVGAVRFGMRGGIIVALAAVPVAALFEQQRAHWFHVGYRIEFVTFQAGAGLLMALLVGWIVTRLDEQRATAEQRAEEAEALRDELGRRADLLDAANRCARALSSSLDLDEAVNAFIRELRGLVPFDRMAIVLAEDGMARIIATVGEQTDDAISAGAEFDPENSLISDVVARGQTVYRRDMSHPLYVEEDRLLALGLRSRVAAPLLAGARTIGLLSLSRSEPDAFQEHEIELTGLLGRLAASAVQNIRAYEGERRTVEELRRLSALRADFVSLVSHELRSPMAAVIGAARTLQARWRELQPDQRESFLALIGDETTRLAALIGDVLDTSRIDAGTFSFRFSDVDVAALVRDMVATAAYGQDEVPIVVEATPDAAVVRGDPERLRQIFGNLIDNAVKYSPVGGPVEVRVSQSNGAVTVSVRDRGPGIKAADQRVIFEKFGRVAAGNSKPGSGLGLYIARSIAETHGGTIAVSSAPGRGATFTVTLPA
jgi:signal transduction histidine kinase